MKESLLLGLLPPLLLVVTVGTASADWPQWRGPDRDGVVIESLPLDSSWDDGGPPRTWQSEPFPERAGEGSVIVSDGPAYLYINWPREEEIETRTLDAQALKKLGWFNENDVPKDLFALIENARQNRSSRLRGSKGRCMDGEEYSSGAQESEASR